MHRIVPLLALVSIVACKKDDAPAPAAKEAPSGSSAAAAPAPTPTPTPPPAAPAPTPVKMTAEELKPTCPKIVTTELAAKTHGATDVKPQGSGADKPLAICELSKGGELVGSITIACNPDLDPTAIERERGAMTKAKDLPGPVGRGGYRLSSVVFFIDDETPCRIQAAWVTPPEDAAWTEALRAIAAAVNPSTLK